MVSRWLERLEGAFRRGSSVRGNSSIDDVARRGHTIVLGWSSQAVTVISELLAAGGPARPGVFVMADMDEQTMETSIRQRIRADKRSPLVCLSGRPSEASDIARLDPQHASSILVLPGDEADADAQVLRTILTLANSAVREKATYHVVAVLRDPNHAGVTHATTGGLDLEVVVVDDLIARMMAQCCLQPPLLPVFEELLTYAGNEIYISPANRLEGLTFGDAQYCYETSIPLGVRSANGSVRVLPPAYTPFVEGDQIIALSADANAVKLRLTEDAAVDEGALEVGHVAERAPCRILIVGYNRRAWLLIKQLDHLVAGGSMLKVVVDRPADAAAIPYYDGSLTNLTLAIEQRDTSDPHVLDGLVGEHYDHIVVLLGTDFYGPGDANARTVAIVRHMRDTAWRSNRPFSLIGEIWGSHKLAIQASFHESDGFLEIDRMVSLMVSQVSDSRERSRVFEQLFDAAGPLFSFRPASAYVSRNHEVSFYTVVEAARRRGEVAVGYRLRSQREPQRDSRAVINPGKTRVICFTDEDEILVLARRS